MLVTYAAYQVRDAALTAALAAPALAAVVLDAVLRRAVLRRAGGAARRVAEEPDAAGAPEPSPRTVVRTRAGVGSRGT